MFQDGSRQIVSYTTMTFSYECQACGRFQTPNYSIDLGDQSCARAEIETRVMLLGDFTYYFDPETS